MGKGDKKTRRGKIILGTFGARRRRKTAYVKEIVPSAATSVKDLKEKKPVKEKTEGREAKSAAEVKENKPVREKAAPRAVKPVKEKKEAVETPVESKPKKEKKS